MQSLDVVTQEQIDAKFFVGRSGVRPFPAKCSADELFASQGLTNWPEIGPARATQLGVFVQNATSPAEWAFIGRAPELGDARVVTPFGEVSLSRWLCHTGTVSEGRKAKLAVVSSTYSASEVYDALEVIDEAGVAVLFIDIAKLGVNLTELNGIVSIDYACFQDVEDSRHHVSCELSSLLANEAGQTEVEQGRVQRLRVVQLPLSRSGDYFVRASIVTKDKSKDGKLLLPKCFSFDEAAPGTRVTTYTKH